jgi:hypothetical protein
VTDDERRFVNNPFARALHPERQRRTVGQWVALILVSVVGAAIMGASFVLPLVFAHGLLTGARGRWGMVVAGVLVASIYALILVRVVKLARRRRG